MRMATDAALIAGSFATIDHLRVAGRKPSAWAPLSGFFPTGDGWVRLHANYPHHAQAIHEALGVSNRDDLAAALTDRTAHEVEALLVEHRGVAVAVRTTEEWRASPHGVATADEPWSVRDVRGARRSLPPTHGGVLEGVRVLDLTRVIAGPTCSQMLACLGADVLRIDPPDRPELLDQHLSNGMGKRSAAADLAARVGEVEALLEDADVVLLGYRPGSLERFGLGPEALLQRHPHLIVASLSAWGESGPWATRPGFDSIVQAACGIAIECGSSTVDARPGALPVQALDHSTGYVMAAEVMNLLTRARSGIVRISLLGAARTLLSHPRQGQHDHTSLPVESVSVASPRGCLTLPPPPITVDGARLHRPVGGYARASLTWLGTDPM